MTKNLALPLVAVAILLAGGAAYFLLPSRGSLPLPVPSQPAWLQQLIAQQQSEPVAQPPALVERCEYQGRVVYFLPQRCCDFFSNLYTSDGEIMCHPDGGISGRGDGKCGDFMATKQNCQLVWRDERS